PLRLFNDQLGGEISWLLPLAAVAAVVGIWSRRGAPRNDLARAGYVLWGLWLLTHAVVFSFAGGILHSYYTVAMAPAVAGLVGGGAVELWRHRSRWLIGGLAAAVALVVTAWWGSQLLARTPDFAPGLGTLELAAAVAAAAVLLLPRLRGLPTLLPAAALVAGLAAVMLGPSAYAFATVARAQNSPDPRSGPATAGAFGGPGGGARFAGPPGGGAFFGGGGQPPSRGGPGGAPGFGGAQPGGFGGGAADSTVISYLEQHQGGATWLVATPSAGSGASIALATGRPVLAMGGFSGGDPAMTLDRLQELVRSGQLRYVLLDGRGGGRGGPDQGTQSVTSWIAQHCATVSGISGLYDCSTAVGGSAA
ncbi:MAG TPA: glycosyl transferase family 39, partial [Candidatus Dormibacteraeota bacterium]